jgi:hypothetical protein
MEINHFVGHGSSENPLSITGLAFSQDFKRLIAIDLFVDLELDLTLEAL